MTKTVLIIDPKSDWYRSRLAPRVPSLELRAAPDRDAGLSDAAGADAILAMGHAFNDKLVTTAKRLKWIQAFTTGMDQILGLKSLRPEIVLTSMRGIHGPQMSEMAFLHMLALSRSYRRMSNNQDKGVWEKIPQHRLCGKTVVIVGVGLISEELAPRCKAFGMNVIGVTSAPRTVPGFDRMMRRSELEQAARLADFMIVLAPYTAENDRLVSAKVIAAMKPTAYLINIARGGVCDEDAILAAVRERRIAGAGLDVFRTEPLPPQHPFWREENIVITPRQSGGTSDYHELTLPTLEHNLKCFAEERLGDMVNVVPH
jgi:phosphoglycerate dehydrogenase-like enzyme